MNQQSPPPPRPHPPKRRKAPKKIGAKDNPLIHEVKVPRSQLGERLEAEGVRPVALELMEGVAARVAKGYQEGVLNKALLKAGGRRPTNEEEVRQ